MQTSLYTLLVLCDYVRVVEVPTPAPTPANPDAVELVSEVQDNMYRLLLSSIASSSDLEILTKCIGRLLNTTLAADASLLPFSRGQFVKSAELLTLLWRSLETNRAHLEHLATREDAGTLLIAPLLYQMWTGRATPERIGLVHLCSFILLLLSSERPFAISLNAPLAESLPAGDLPLFETGATHVDLLIVVLHKLIVEGSAALSPLFSCFLTIIVNVSPYAKNLSLPSATRLIALVELVSAPRFLLARPGNFSFVQQLLEAFNNLIQYQYESNAVLVYAMVRRREVFERLGVISVSAWLEKEQREKIEDALAATSPPSTVTAAAAAASASTLSITEGGEAATAPAAAATATTKKGVRKSTTWADRNVSSSASASSCQIRDASSVSGSSAPTESANSAAASSALTSTGGGAWVPSDAWFESTVKPKLQMDAVQRLITYLAPILKQHVQKTGSAGDDSQVLDFIRSTTVVGVLPAPHAILVRRYTSNAYTNAWFTTFTFSNLYLHLARECPLFDARAIRMFQIVIV